MKKVYNFSHYKGAKIVAYAHFKPIGEGYDVIDIFVLPQWRRKKIGRKILTNFAEKAKPLSMMLEVRKSNSPAIKLYDSFGFTIISTRVNYYSDGEDAYVMKWEKYE